jgi:PEP-CTERM motif
MRRMKAAVIIYWEKVMKIGVLSGALALAGVFAIPAGVQAATLTVDLNDYASGVNSAAGQTLATMTVMDLAGGGVSVSFALDSPATFFASTGGNHITAAINLDTSITAADITDTTPGFDIVIPVNGVPGPSGGFGDFSVGLQGDWNGTSNHFAGPITFDISGISVSDFVVNSDGYFAVADALGNVGTGDIGGKIGTVVGTPEPSTWAMMLLGFAGLGFAGYRKSQRGRIAPSVA